MNKLFQLLLVAALIIVSNSNTSEQVDIKRVKDLMNELAPLVILKKNVGEWSSDNWLHTSKDPILPFKNIFGKVHNIKDASTIARFEKEERIYLHSQAAGWRTTWLSKNINPDISIHYLHKIRVPNNLSKKNKEVWRSIFGKTSGEIGMGIYFSQRLTSNQVKSADIKWSTDDSRHSDYYAAHQNTVCRFAKLNYNSIQVECSTYDKPLEELFKQVDRIRI